MVSKRVGNEDRTYHVRSKDVYRDRRSGDDRRHIYDLYNFEIDEMDRRGYKERRFNKERRKGCVRVSTWSSVCNESEDEH
ncbi:MAG: hypothetical protein ACI8ZB_000291 [Desulforhopalus sp.]|jgi:hypothetical protein